jgi:hypothetical protein
MNKEQLNQKLSDLEEEAANLRSLINEPEKRTPEAGDVWETKLGRNIIVGQTSENCFNLTLNSDDYSVNDTMTYLGKFSEVFVKIADVRDAVVSYSHQGSTVMSTEALCDLNIITL